MLRVILLLCLSATAYCQFFGGLQPLGGGGGFNQQAGYRGSVFQTPNSDVSAWGSLSQFKAPTYSSPITYSGGADWTAPRGSLSAGASLTPGVGSSLNLGGSASIYKTPAYAVNAFGSHTRNFGPNSQPLGSSSTAGLGILEKNGASLSGSITHIPGIPNIGNVQGNLPIVRSKDGNTNLDLNGGVTFGGGRKPEPNVGITFSKKF